jgi:hypothetical protein
MPSRLFEELHGGLPPSYVGVVPIVGEELEVTLDAVKTWLNRPTIASRHRHPPSFKGKQNDLLASPRCHRTKAHQEWSPEVAGRLPPVSSHGAPP